MINKTICVSHSIDLDGWMSAAIIKKLYLEQNEKLYITNTSQHYLNGKKVSSSSSMKYSSELTFLGWTYGDTIPDLTNYDKVIICDISFPKEIMDKLHIKLQENFIWIDHHISAIKEWGMTAFMPNGLLDTKFAACELTWKCFFPNKEMPEIVRLLGRYDCFGYMGSDEEKKVIEFQYGARMLINNYETAYEYLITTNHTQVNSIHIDGAAIYRYLCVEAKDIYKKGFPILLGDKYYCSVDPISKIAATQTFKTGYNFLCINKEHFNPQEFGIDYYADGYDGIACFNYNNGMWKFDLYNANGEVDCSEIAKKYGGGGHRGASGFRIKDLKEIIKTI